jgi:hypothetical protein
MTTTQEELIEKLYQQTKSQTVSWEKTSLSTQFALKMKAGTILITEINGDVQLTVLNLKGDKLETILMSKSTSRLYQIYELVSRQVNHNDDALKNFVAELS